MRQLITATLALCALAVAGRADNAEPPGAAAELKKLKGTWVATRRMAKGDEVKAPAGTTYTFDGDKLTRTTASAKGEQPATAVFKFKIDTRKRPHRIELMPEGGKKVQPGIYKIENGELYLALGPAHGRGAAGLQRQVQV